MARRRRATCAEIGKRIPVLGKMGRRYPQLTGNGRLQMSEKAAEDLPATGQQASQDTSELVNDVAAAVLTALTGLIQHRF